jgi:hypothetical protein
MQYQTNYISQLNIILIKVVFLCSIFMKYYLFKMYTTFILPCKITVVETFNVALLINYNKLHRTV